MMKKHYQRKQPIAVCTRAETLVRFCPCATCIWLLHPTPTSVVGHAILALNRCKQKCHANILPPALPFSVWRVHLPTLFTGAVSNPVKSGMTILLSTTYTLNSLSTLSSLWKCWSHMASTFDAPCVSSPLACLQNHSRSSWFAVGMCLLYHSNTLYLVWPFFATFSLVLPPDIPIPLWLYLMLSLLPSDVVWACCHLINSQRPSLHLHCSANSW